MKIVTKWLRSYKHKDTACYVIMYHATGKDVPVLEQGLLVGKGKRKNFGISDDGYVYLATTPRMAEMFGDLAYNEGCVVYEVIVPVNKLLSNRQHLYYSGPIDITCLNLVNSLVYVCSARVKGNIERWQIKRFEKENLWTLKNLSHGK